MLAWLELLIGSLLGCCGTALMVDAFNQSPVTVEDERYALYGLIAFVIGGFLFLIGFIVLVGRVFEWIIS
jgi:cell division protein FtsX